MKQSSFFLKAKEYILLHKVISGIAAIAIIWGGYSIVKSFTSTTGETAYVVEAAQVGTVVSTISGSGQVSASSEIEVTSKVSGSLISLNAVTGQEVKAGTLLAQVDSKDAAMNLESAQLSLQKLTSPDTVSLLQSQNAVTSAKQQQQSANDNLSNYYTTGLATVASTFVDFPSIINGLNSMFYTSSGTLNDIDTTALPAIAQQYRNDAGMNLDNAKSKYSNNLLSYRQISTLSSTTDTEKIIDQTLDTAQTLLLAVKNAKSTLDYLKNINQEGTLKNVTTAQTNLNSWLSQISNDVTSLTTAKNNISNGKVAILNAQSSLGEKQASLDALYKNSSDLDVRSQQLVIAQREEDYQNYFIRAPFDGVVAKVNVKSFDPINSGTSIVTLVAKQKVAEITLNEVDISKVKVGQKVTLTFDAIDGLTLTGTVAEADLVGTVSQGVVTYAVKIAFDADDSRVLSGMTVNAVIATNVKQDVVMVPNSAIRTQGGSSYVQLVTDPSAATSTVAQTLQEAPINQQVTVGISDDEYTEIVSGLAEGDKVVTKTVAATAAKTTAAAAPSLFGSGASSRGATRATPTP